MQSTGPIASRTVGQYPLSIATSLAIESANGIHPDILVNKAPILNYQELWINIRTLCRNILGSIDKDSALRINPPEIADAIIDEMDMIKSIINEQTNNRVKVVYYYSNYKDLNIHFKRGVVRMDNTDNQKHNTLLRNQTFKALFAKLKNQTDFNLKLVDLYLAPENAPKALILTHYAIDLLSYKGFSHLTLLESHTGHLKERAQWYTKYYNGKELTNIPFNSGFIQLLGDNETFRPADIRIRKDLMEVASKYNWSAISTRDKLMYSVDNGIKNPYSKEIIKSVM